MNTIVNTQPPVVEEFNPLDRPSNKLDKNDRGQIVSVQPRPLLLIGREPVSPLPSRRALALFDALLAPSWKRLEHATPAFEFGAYGQFLRVQVGEGSHESNDRLMKAFDELVDCQWRFPVQLMSDHFFETAILSKWTKQGRIFIWHFTPPVIALCQHVPLWTRYPIHTARTFAKAHEHRLHELLRVFADRNFPIWNVPIAELRRLMGDVTPMSDDRYILDVIVPVARTIAQTSRWHIKIERLPDPKVQPSDRVRFTIRKPGSQLPATK